MLLDLNYIFPLTSRIPPHPAELRHAKMSIEGWFYEATNLLRAGRHDWTAFLCAKICDGAVQHVDLVEEIHS